MLVRLAYRMLGSMAEAEDVVQDAWLRWRAMDQDNVHTPAAMLNRIVTNLCLDVMKSSRKQRETYVGSWLPEPLIEITTEDDRLDDLTLPLMLALERLSPLERAAFLLHDVFDMPMDEIAALLKREPAAVRQLAARARTHVQEAKPRYPVAREEGEQIVSAFFAAVNSGNMNALQGLLADNVVLQSDGGGKAHAWRNPIIGIENMVRLFAGMFRKMTLQPAVYIRPVWIDGLPGYISRERDDVLQTNAFAIEDGKITHIFITRNPDKLGGAKAVAFQDETGRKQP